MFDDFIIIYFRKCFELLSRLPIVITINKHMIIAKLEKRIVKKSTIRKRRLTRRTNQVNKFANMMNIGDADKKGIVSLLSKQLNTKKGVQRSKRIEALIQEGNIEKLKMFKEFQGLKKLDTSKLTLEDTIKSINRSDYDFYYEHKKLISDYNKTYKTYKKSYGNGFMDEENINFFRPAKLQFNRETTIRELQNEYAKYANSKLKDEFKGK